jgi:hypothetical protein
LLPINYRQLLCDVCWGGGIVQWWEHEFRQLSMNSSLVWKQKSFNHLWNFLHTRKEDIIPSLQGYWNDWENVFKLLGA